LALATGFLQVLDAVSRFWLNRNEAYEFVCEFIFECVWWRGAKFVFVELMGFFLVRSQVVIQFCIPVLFLATFLGSCQHVERNCCQGG
jgi:hypothetical protein